MPLLSEMYGKSTIDGYTSKEMTLIYQLGGEKVLSIRDLCLSNSAKNKSFRDIFL